MKKSIVIIVILAALGGVWWYATNGATSEKVEISVAQQEAINETPILVPPDPTADDGFDPSNYDAEAGFDYPEEPTVQ